MKDLKKEFFEKFKDKAIRFRENDGSFSMDGYELWEWIEEKLQKERKRTLEEVERIGKRKIRKFVKLWNERNGFVDGINESENMRMGDDGVIYWNIYDSPEVDLNQILELLSKLKDKGE